MIIKPLTKTEKTILHLIAKGLSYKEIATIKEVKLDTIKKHCYNSYKKLNIKNRMEAAKLVYENKI